MSERETAEQEHIVEYEYDIDEPPQKVWRAISDADYRERWLPANDHSDLNVVSVIPDKEVSYQIREKDSPFLESSVTIRVHPNIEGGTKLRIIHEITDPRFVQTERSTNADNPLLMLAA